MKLQRLLAGALFVLACVSFLSMKPVSIPEKDFVVCRATPITELQDIEDDVYLAAVMVEVKTLVAANPNLTDNQLVSALMATHESVAKVEDTIEYRFIVGEDGIERRVCTARIVVSVSDPSQLVPVYVEMNVTVTV